MDFYTLYDKLRLKKPRLKPFLGLHNFLEKIDKKAILKMIVNEFLLFNHIILRNRNETANGVVFNRYHINSVKPPSVGSFPIQIV